MAEFEVAVSTESSGENSRIFVWDLASSMQLKSYKGSCCACQGVAMLGKNYIVAAHSGKPVLHVWNLAKEQIHMKLTCPGKVSAIACSPNGKYCVVSCAEIIYIWQVASGNLLASLSRHFQGVRILKFSDDGSCFLSGGEDNLVMVWKMARVLSQSTGAAANSSCSPCFTWSDHALPVTDIHCGYGGMQAHVATSSLDQTCKLYDLRSGELLCSFVFGNGITSLSMDSAELNLFAGAVDGTIYQVQLSKPGLKEDNYQSNSGHLVFHGHSKRVNSLSTSMDGSLLLSGSHDYTARVWHVTSKQCLRVVNHKGPVTNALVMPRPVYLDSAPLKTMLPPIGAFKKHVHVWPEPQDALVKDTSIGKDSSHNGVVMILRGSLSKREDYFNKEKQLYVHQMAEQIIKEGGGADQGRSNGELRQLSRNELLQNVETLGIINQGLYRFAVDDLLGEVCNAIGEAEMLPSIDSELLNRVQDA